MDVHKNARLTPAGREIMVRRAVEGGQTPQALSAAVGVCPRTVRKWVGRYRADGVAGLRDRSSRPHRLRQPTPPETVARMRFPSSPKVEGFKHIRTKPYTPKTNGKAERFIQSALREWAYAQAYTHSDRRTAELPRWLHRYNWHRPHGSLDAKTPISRLGLSENNLLRLHI
jgi:transposase-like protein